MAEQSPKVPENFHALYDRAARESRGVTVRSAGAPRAAVTRMTAEVPNLEVHFDEATHNPVQVVVTGAVRARGLSKRAAPSPETAARQFVQDRADLWQLDDRDVGTVDVVSVSTTGLPTVKMLQKVDGVEVFQSDMTAALGAEQQRGFGIGTAVSRRRDGAAARGSPRCSAEGSGKRPGGTHRGGSNRQGGIRSHRASVQGERFQAGEEVGAPRRGPLSLIRQQVESRAADREAG